MQTAVTSQTAPPAGFAAPAAVGVPATSSAGVSAWLRRYAWCVVGWNIAVILWGAVVRATGSGAGCGNHWPLCNGEVVPTSPRVATLIEFTHRAMTGGATITIVALLIWTFRATRGRHLARFFAVASTVLLLNEAFLGALLVKLGYVVHDQSPGRFIVLPIHLANTLLLLAALALTAHFLARASGFMNGSVEYRFFGLSAIGLVSTIAVGVTGSLAALGDTLFPAATLAQAFAQDLSRSSPWVLRLRWMHPAAALLAGLFVVGIIWVSGSREDPANRKLANWVIGLLLSQLALGVLDVLLRAPAWMQILHLLGADIYWIALVVLAARITIVPLGCPGGFCRLGLGLAVDASPAATPNSLADSHLSGLAGWLSLVGLGLVFEPPLILYGLWANMQFMNRPDYDSLSIMNPGLSSLLIYQLVTGMSLLAGLVFLNVEFFTKKKTFPKYFIIYLLVAIAVSFVEYGICPERLQADVAGKSGRAIIAGVVWILYFRQSRRVKATFVN